MRSLGRWWARLAGAPMRAFARRLSSRFPRASHDGIDLLIGDPRLVDDAEDFFARTIDALRCAATRAPAAYARLRKDLRAIVLRGETADPPYQRFQLAVLVPRSIVLETDPVAYAAWLLYASGLARGTQEADDRASKLLQSVESDRRKDVQALLPRSEW
jgi:hypothetical protein